MSEEWPKKYPKLAASGHLIVVSRASQLSANVDLEAAPAPNLS